MRRWTQSNGCILTGTQLTPGICLCSSSACLPSSLPPSLCLSISRSLSPSLSPTLIAWLSLSLSFPLSALSLSSLVHSLILSPFSLPLYSIQLSNSPSLSLSCSLSRILSVLSLWCYSMGRQVSILARQLRCAHYLPVRQSEVSSIPVTAERGTMWYCCQLNFAPDYKKYKKVQKTLRMYKRLLPTDKNEYINFSSLLFDFDNCQLSPICSSKIPDQLSREILFSFHPK